MLLLAIVFLFLVEEAFSAVNLNHKSSSLKVQKGAKNGKLSHIHNKKEGKALQLKKSFKGIFKFKTDSLMDPMGKLKLNIRFKSEKSQTWTWKAKSGSKFKKLGTNPSSTKGSYGEFTLNIPKSYIKKSTVQVQVVGPKGDTGLLDYQRLKVKYCPTKVSKLPKSLKNCPFTRALVKEADWTYQLKESTSQYKFWTSPVSDKLKESASVPSEKNSGITIHAAKNEFEPFQVIIKKGVTGSVPISMKKFKNLGKSQRVELYKQVYDASGWVEDLSPIGSTLQLENGRHTGVWVNVYVPKKANKGKYKSNLVIDGVKIPVTLIVFGWKMPDKVNFATQMNIGISSLGSNQDKNKRLLLEHRWTPKSGPIWPSGLSYTITWDRDANPNKCEQFWDEPNECPNYCVKELAPKYVLGNGWSGEPEGFPNVMAFQFVDNSTPRPSTFCGQNRGTHYGTTAYNNQWKKYLSALEQYLIDNNMIKKAYYYVQNEPQNQDDYDLAIFLCQLTKGAAPKLRIAISEEPKPQIANDCGYDIWIAHVAAYDQTYAWQRRALGEEVWFYSLPQDANPHWNPTLINKPGTHVRAISWSAWMERITGYAYYDAGTWFNNGQPGVRAELMREMLEDYEYFYAARGNKHPVANKIHDVDISVKAVVQSLTSWSKNHALYMATRLAIGKYLEGSTSQLPVAILQASSGGGSASPVYINFQNPSGEPTANPLQVSGKTYQKIGFESGVNTNGFNPSLGYGFTVDAGAVQKMDYANWPTPPDANPLQRSYIYDDYGRQFTFEYGLPNGDYKVTIGIGRPTSSISDLANVYVQGIHWIQDYNHNTGTTLYEKTGTFSVTDGILACTFGGRDGSGSWSYTFLNYMHIVPA